MDFIEKQLIPTKEYKSHLSSAELQPIKEYLEGGKYYVEVKVDDKTFIYDNEDFCKVAEVRGTLDKRLTDFYKRNSKDLILSDIEGLKEI